MHQEDEYLIDVITGVDSLQVPDVACDLSDEMPEDLKGGLSTLEKSNRIWQ